MKGREGIYVAAGLPTSMAFVANDIAQALGLKFVRTPFRTPYDGHLLPEIRYLIYVTDSRIFAEQAAYNMPADHIIFYLITEGPIINFYRDMLDKHAVVVPTEWHRRLYEKEGVKVAKVIPHGIHVYDNEPDYDNRKGYFYRAYYSSRKYPDEGLRAYTRFMEGRSCDGTDIYLVGGKPFPMDEVMKDRIPCAKVKNGLTREEMKELYERHAFYMNLSDVEGFGLTTIEAMERGEVVITDYYPAAREIIPQESNIIVVPDRVEEEFLGFEVVWHYHYKEEDYYEALKYSEQVFKDREEYRRMAKENRSWALNFDYRKVYEAFIEVMGELGWPY